MRAESVFERTAEQRVAVAAVDPCVETAVAYRARNQMARVVREREAEKRAGDGRKHLQLICSDPCIVGEPEKLEHGALADTAGSRDVVEWRTDPHSVASDANGSAELRGLRLIDRAVDLRTGSPLRTIERALEYSDGARRLYDRRRMDRKRTADDQPWRN